MSMAIPTMYFIVMYKFKVRSLHNMFLFNTCLLYPDICIFFSYKYFKYDGNFQQAHLLKKSVK